MKKLYLLILASVLALNSAFSQPIVSVWGVADSLAMKRQVIQYLQYLDVQENVYVLVNFTTSLPEKLEGMTYPLRSPITQTGQVIHEFRTPLTLLLGPLEKLLAQPAYEKEHGLFSMMQRNAQRLLHLINQLLDLSKLEAGRMTLEIKPAAIVPFIKAVALSFTSLAERRQIQYRLQYPKEQPIVYFDADKLEKIITNLLSNAFKFIPEGGEITVTTQLHPASDTSIPTALQQAAPTSPIHMLEFSVQDSGAGLSEALTQRVFDRFYQSDSSQNGQEGTGIGLSLVRELVELHEGEVSVVSTPDQGSCFSVRLPVAVADFEEIVVGEPVLSDSPATITLPDPIEDGLSEPLEATSSVAATDTPLVLVVEDNADVRAFIRDTLQADCQVIEACDGVVGFSRAIETIPDLILSDVMMPKMDGVELCAKLKQDERTSHVPVILLTAKASRGDKIEGLETGADDYIIKPFQADELRVRIKNLIENRRKLRKHFSREIILQPTSVSITSADEQFLQKVMQIVERQIANPSFGVEDFGREVGMSRAQSFRKLKALTDHSPGDFIRLMRLKRAAQLLTQGVGNIADVAYQVGFQTPSYFAKCFQKQYGKTPSDYMASTLS